MEKKWLTGYKVVKRQGNRFVSAMAGNILLEKWKIYGIGRRTVRRKGWGPLAVFKKEISATSFMAGEQMYSDKYALFRCRYLSSNDIGYWCMVWGRKRSCTSIIPHRLFADEVELLEEVT